MAKTNLSRWTDTEHYRAARPIGYQSLLPLHDDAPQPLPVFAADPRPEPLSGRERRTRIMDRLSHNGFVSEACTVATRGLEPGEIVTGEAVRSRIEGHGLFAPAGQGSLWGCVIRQLRQRGVLVPTGEWVESTVPRNHARPVAVYEVRP